MGWKVIPEEDPFTGAPETVSERSGLLVVAGIFVVIALLVVLVLGSMLVISGQ